MKVLTPVAAIELGIDVHQGDVVIGVLDPDSGALEPTAVAFASVEMLLAFIAENDPGSISIEGATGEDVTWLCRALHGPDAAPALH